MLTRAVQAKAAGRELQGLEAYFSHILATGSDLYTAMQMLVDYGKSWVLLFAVVCVTARVVLNSPSLGGYRLIASSLLPIGKTSLLYGSNDGGVSVHAVSLAVEACAQSTDSLQLSLCYAG